MGLAAQATYWSAVDLHKAVMSNICDALDRPPQGMHPEETTALAAKADLLATGVAVDEHAKVTIENEGSKMYEESPWAADKRVAEIVRQAPVQSAENVPPKSLARDMAFAMLQSRILPAAEAVQAAKPHHEMPPEHQAIMLGAGGPGTGTGWTAMHKSAAELAQMRNGGWPRRCDSVQRQTRARAPRVQRRGHVRAVSGDAFVPFFFCCKYGRARNRPHRAVQWAMRTWSAMSLSSTIG